MGAGHRRVDSTEAGVDQPGGQITGKPADASGAGSARRGRWLIAVLAVPVTSFACAGFGPGDQLVRRMG